jgi:hypothetical protein
VSAAAPAMEELARSSLLAIDGVLEAVVSRIAEDGPDKPASQGEKERLRRMASRLPKTGAVFIADEIAT